MLHVQCEQTHLLRALAQVNKIAPFKSMLPLLSGLLLIAKRDTLALVTTDLLCGGCFHIPARVVVEGRALIPFKRFFEFVNALDTLPGYLAHPLELQQGIVPDQTSTGRIDNAPAITTPLRLTSRQMSPSGTFWSNQATFTAWRDENYPHVLIASEQGVERYVVDASSFRRALASSVRFPFQAERNQALTFNDYILLRTEEAQLTLLASNGITLSQQVLPLTQPVEQEGVRLFEAPLLAKIEGLLPRTGNVQLSFQIEGESLSLIIETTPESFLFCRGSNSPVPDYRVVDRPYEASILVKRKELLAGLKSTTVLDRQKEGRSLLTAVIEGNTLIMRPYPEDPNMGQSIGRVTLDQQEGCNFEALIHWGRLKKLAEGLTSDQIKIYVGAPSKDGSTLGFLRAEPFPPDGTVLTMELNTAQMDRCPPGEETEDLQHAFALPSATR